MHGVNPYDDYGHGTHVSGLIASKGARSQNIYSGVAPNARIISLKALDSVGQGLTSDVIAAIEFATLNKQALGIDVINLSLGHPILEPAASDPLVRAVEAAVRAGIVVVVSAGNIGRNITTGVSGYGGEFPALTLLEKTARAVGISVGSRAQLKAMEAFMLKHGVKPPIDRVYPHAQLDDAIARMKAGQYVGKIVITL